MLAAAGVDVVAAVVFQLDCSVVFQLDCSLQKHQTEDSYPDHEAATEIFEDSVVPLH